MKQRRINATVTIAALALTTLLILTALPQAGTAAPRLERQPLESLTGLNSTKAAESGAPSVASVVQSPGATTSVPTASNGLTESLWPMFQHDPQRTGRSPYEGPEFIEQNAQSILDEYTLEVVIGTKGMIYVTGYNNLYSFNPNFGQRWTSPLINGMFLAAGPEGTIYVLSDYGRKLI